MRKESFPRQSKKGPLTQVALSKTLMIYFPQLFSYQVGKWKAVFFLMSPSACLMHLSASCMCVFLYVFDAKDV